MSAFNLVQPIKAPRDVLWRALVEPEGLACWQADQVLGVVEPGERIKFRYPALGAEVDATVAEVVPRSRVTFEWSDHSVTFSVEAGGVTLECVGITDADELAGSASAWTLSMATLAHYCEVHAGRSRSVCWFHGTAPTTQAVLHSYLTEPWAHESWLGSGGGFGKLGEDVALSLAPGLTLTGKVLAHTPGRDLLITWTEDDDSVIAFRSLPSPVSDERLVVVSWSRWSQRPAKDGALECLKTAHSRLLTVLRRAGQA